jgi:hypothetical protein
VKHLFQTFVCRNALASWQSNPIIINLGAQNTDVTSITSNYKAWPEWPTTFIRYESGKTIKAGKPKEQELETIRDCMMFSALLCTAFLHKFYLDFTEIERRGILVRLPEVPATRQRHSHTVRDIPQSLHPNAERVLQRDHNIVLPHLMQLMIHGHTVIWRYITTAVEETSLYKPRNRQFAFRKSRFRIWQETGYHDCDVSLFSSVQMLGCTISFPMHVSIHNPGFWPMWHMHLTKRL